MLIVATIVSTDHTRLRQRWKLEGGVPPIPGQKIPANPGLLSAEELARLPTQWRKENYRLLADDEIGPSLLDASFAGLVVVYDWSTRKEIWRRSWGGTIFTPCGISFADDAMYLSDMEGSNCFKVDMRDEPGRIVCRISHPYLNDLHSVERTKNGLLVASSGTDLVLEIGVDGRLLFEWWASEHGYVTTPAGVERLSGRGREHRDIYYHTRFQTTHVNTAGVRDAGERYILALLFHQGQLIEIDRATDERRNTRVVLEGLKRPHTLERFGDGWLICNSVAQELVVLDQELHVSGTIDYRGGWIQDCISLPNGHLLLNDVDKHCIVEFAGASYSINDVVPYDENWRMGELCVMPAALEPAFLKAIAPDPMARPT